jgi:hypothetical protein
MIAEITFIVVYIIGIASVLTFAYDDYIAPKVAIILAILWPVMALFAVGNKLFD